MIHLHNLKRWLLDTWRGWIRRRFGATAGDDARRFNRLDEAIAAYRNYLKFAPRDLGVQLRLAGVLSEAGRSEEAAVRLADLVKERPGAIKVQLVLAHILDEIGALDEARTAYCNVLDLDPSNVSAQTALKKIDNAAAFFNQPLPAPPLGKYENRVNLRIAAAGASEAAVMATLQSTREDPTVRWSVEVTGFKGELPNWTIRTPAECGSDNIDCEVADLHVEAGVTIKAGAVEWLLWAVDQGATAAYADHEVGGGEVVLHAAPSLTDLETSPVPPSLAIFRGRERGLATRVHERLAEAMSTGLVMHIPLVLSGTREAPSLRVGKGSGKIAEERILLVIPTRDALDDLVVMVRSLVKTASQPKMLDIVVVDNGSRQDILSDAFGDTCGATVSVVRIDEAFNWSRLNNQACEGRDQPIFVFANNDMEMLTAGWDDHIRSLLGMERVGVVGARLLYPDGRLQHGGIVMGGLNGEPLHDGWRAHGDDPGPLGRWMRRRPATAVTGGFMAVQRSLFEAVGGFDEVDLPISCSDVDLCLKVRAQGWTVLYAPEIELTHHESLTRGHAHDSAQKRRAQAEMRVLLERWGDAAACDPTRNPQWETRGVRLYAGRRSLTTDQVVDWALKTASRPEAGSQADTPTLA